MSKRKLSMNVESLEVSKITSSSTKVNVVGVISELSPIKQGRCKKYFNGQVTDGKMNMRMVGFNEEVHQKLEQKFKDLEPVKLTNVRVKESNTATGLEILMNDGSAVESSQELFELPAPSTLTLSLKDVDTVSPGTKFNILVKIINVKLCRDVKTKYGLTDKAEVLLADENATAKLVVWGEKCSVFTVGDFKSLQNVTVEEYRGERNIKLADFSIIEEGEKFDSKVEHHIKGEITAINIQRTFWCGSCRGKLEPLGDANKYFRCKQCCKSIKAKSAINSVAAEIDVKTPSSEIKSVSLFEDKIAQILEMPVTDVKNILSLEEMEMMLLDKDYVEI